MATDWESLKIDGTEINNNSVAGVTGSQTKYTGVASQVKALIDQFPNFITTEFNKAIQGIIDDIVTETPITVTASSITTLTSAKAFKRNGVIYVQVTGEASGNDINAATPTNEQSGSGLFTLNIGSERIKPSSAVYVGTSWTMPASSTPFTSAWRAYPYFGADGYVRISTGIGTSKTFKYFGVNMMIPESVL